MPINQYNYTTILAELNNKATLIAVSKTKPIEDIKELYNLGQRHFGENYVQELVEKYEQLPKDIHWHFIGHLQSNKVKHIAPFVYLIHGVDSLSLLKEINKQAQKNNRVINCLLQVHIAQEETKFGFSVEEVEQLFVEKNETMFQSLNIKIIGLMGMASFTSNDQQIKNEFSQLKNLFTKLSTHHSPLTVLSMGMSSDYKIALQQHSNMVRIGSLLFGERNYSK